MEKYAHATIGAVGFVGVAAPVYEIISRPLTPNEMIFGMVVSAGSACFADLDTAKSAASTCLGRVSLAFHNFIAPLAGGHRRGTHSIWGLIFAIVLAGLASNAGSVSVFFPLLVVFIPMAIFFRLCFAKIGPWPLTAAMAAAASIWMLTNTVDTGWIMFAFGIGYALHILADMLTVQGVAPLYPFIKKPIGIPLFKSGGSAEKPLTYIVGLAGAYMLCVGLFIPQLIELQERERGGSSSGQVSAMPESSAGGLLGGVGEAAANQAGRATSLAKTTVSGIGSSRDSDRQEKILALTPWGEASPIPRCSPTMRRGEIRVAHPSLTCGQVVTVCHDKNCATGKIVARSRESEVSVRGSARAGEVAVSCHGCGSGDVTS